MIFNKGDRVRVRNERNDHIGTIELVSENQISLAVTFDGEQVAIRTANGGLAITRALPLMQNPPDHFEDLWGDTWSVEAA